MPAIEREPFDFVRYPDGNAIDYDAATGHDRFRGRSGHLECELTALSPFLVMDSHERAGSNQMNTGKFMRNRSGYIIPGTSLKGMVRSLFEVLYPSCTQTTGRGSRVPNAFKPCRSRSKMCPACRVFGFLSGGTVHKGQVNLGTAHANKDEEGKNPRADTARQLIPLFTPDPTEPKYNEGGRAKGYKFYYHQPKVQRAMSSNDEKFGNWVAPLPAGTTFSFTVTFENLTDKELNALVAALVLTDAATDPETGDTVAVRPKLGYGKPAGLGSVAIRLTKVEIQQNARQAYRSFDRSPMVMTEDSGELSEWVSKRQQLFFGAPNRTVKDLIRILRYPPREDVKFKYDYEHDG